MPSLDLRAPYLLTGAVFAYFAAAFLLPTEPASAFFVYAGVLPLLLMAWPSAKLTRNLDAAAVCALGLIVYSGASVLWGINNNHRALRFALDSAACFGFILALIKVFTNPFARRRALDVMIIAGCVNAVIAISWFFLHPVEDPRLHGYGISQHPILGAMVIAVPYLAALGRGLAQPALRTAHLLAAALLASFILMTESRGPMLAATLATVFLCAAGPWRWRALLVFAGIATAWAMLPASMHDHQEAVLVARGASHRIDIWSFTVHSILDRPLFGHGLAANLQFGEFTFPHDVYLSLLFYGGVGGLALFAAMIGLIARHLWRSPHDVEWLILIALFLNLLVGGLTDLGQITKGPGALWLILWLPVGLVLGRDAATGAPRQV